MTLLVDPRAGSRDLARHFTTVRAVVPRHNLPADVMFTGNGPHGKLQIGIEYKKLPDALECIKTGRLADIQIPEMARNFDEYWLWVEPGIIRRSPDNGLLEVRRGQAWLDTKECGWGKRPWAWSEWEGWLTSIMVQGGVKMWPFMPVNASETARQITALYQWYQKPWEDHKSFKQMFLAKAPALAPSSLLADVMEDDDVGRMRRCAASLPGIGWEISLNCVDHFGSIERMMTATVEEWSEIVIGRKGKQRRRLGVVTARKIVGMIKTQVREKIKVKGGRK